MTNIKRIVAGALLPLLFLGGVMAMTAPIADAAFDPDDRTGALTTAGGEFTTSDPTEDTIFESVGNIVNIFLGILGIIFFLYILWAGFIWMTAAGDGGKVEKAQKMMIQGTIGIIIILSAYAISFFAIDQLLEATGNA